MHERRPSHSDHESAPSSRVGRSRTPSPEPLLLQREEDIVAAGVARADAGATRPLAADTAPILVSATVPADTHASDLGSQPADTQRRVTVHLDESDSSRWASRDHERPRQPVQTGLRANPIANRRADVGPGPES